MCRGFDQNGRRSKSNDDEVLKIKAFYVRLLFSTTTHHSSLASQSHYYDSLTLHFPPRINGGPLEIDGFALRPDAPAFVTLHRVVVTTSAEAVYGSRERLRVSEGLRFEIYACDVKVLKGIVRRKDEENWRLDLDLNCKPPHVGGGEELQLQLSVETGLAGVEISEKRSRRIRSEYSLEEIPEQRESVSDIDDCCCCGDGKEDADEWRRGVVHGECDCEVEVEGVKWAVDVAIWVVCLGVGYLVSKASRSHRSIRMQSRLF